MTQRLPVALLLLTACGNGDTGTRHIRTLSEGAEAPAHLEVLDAAGDPLEQRLSDEEIGEQAIWDWIPHSDGVSVGHLRRNRSALLRASRHAKERYRQILSYR